MAARGAVLMALAAWMLTLWRGWLQGGSVNAVLWQAFLALVSYGVIGALVGWTASWIVQLGARDTLASAQNEPSS